jgi:carboxymethylenebutenolidase
MGIEVELTAADGHRLCGYLAEPAARPRGGIVIIQEIFGVTRHIRAVTDQYAAAGYLAVAPSLFDRVERGVDLPYTELAQGFSFVKALTDEQVLLDLQAAVGRVAAAGRVGVVGFCWGGTIAYLAATALPLSAAVAYYGGGITRYIEEKPRAPVMFHFGDQDAHIPQSTVAEIKAAFPQGIYYSYPAGHGFNCTDRASFDPGSAALALERSLEFLHRTVG